MGFLIQIHYSRSAGQPRGHIMMTEQQVSALGASINENIRAGNWQGAGKLAIIAMHEAERRGEHELSVGFMREAIKFLAHAPVGGANGLKAEGE